MLYKDDDFDYDTFFNSKKESIKIEDFYRELKKYPVENGMIQKEWIAEIFEKIKFKPLGMPMG